MMATSERAANLAAGLESAHAGHVHVEQHEIETLIADRLQRLFAGLGVEDFIALRG